MTTKRRSARAKRCAGTKDKILRACSTKTFTQNVRNCICRTGKKREQCVAIAYSVMRAACKKKRPAKKSRKR